MSEPSSSSDVLHGARTAPGWTGGAWAYPALFLGSLIESTVLPWPIEFPLLAVMLRGREHVMPAALVVTSGSVLGCALAFLLGARAYDLVGPWLADHPAWADAVAAARGKAEERGAVAVLLGMMSPVPVQITSFAAGAAGVASWAFLGAALLGRTIRYFAMAVLVLAFGPQIVGWWRSLPRWAKAIGLLVFAALFGVAVYWTLAA